MKKSIIISLFILLFASTISSCISDSKDADKKKTPEYQLVWSDEFDINGLPNPEKWSYDIGGHGWGNEELQYYTDRAANANVQNGLLYIEARKEAFEENLYTSARLVSKNKGDWLYGKFEVRAKLPYGNGTWPAIWMLPTDWEYGGWPKSGEIDIMEHVGWDMGKIHGTVHTEAYNHKLGTQKGGETFCSDAAAAFHTYSTQWTPDSIAFLVDDLQYYVFHREQKTYKEWPFDKRFHLILNVALGGWGGAVDDSILPQTMVVDWVRVYQKKTF